MIKQVKDLSLSSLDAGRQRPDRMYYRDAVDTRVFTSDGTVVADDGEWVTSDGEMFVETYAAWHQDVADRHFSRIPAGWKVRGFGGDESTYSSFRVILPTRHTPSID